MFPRRLNFLSDATAGFRNVAAPLPSPVHLRDGSIQQTSALLLNHCSEPEELDLEQYY